MFDTKIAVFDSYVIAVTRYTVSNKKILLFFYFSPEVSAFLIEKCSILDSRYSILAAR